MAFLNSPVRVGRVEQQFSSVVAVVNYKTIAEGLDIGKHQLENAQEKISSNYRDGQSFERG